MINMMAVLLIGANDLFANQMVEYARENWGLVDRYSNEKRLLEDAKSKGIKKVLVYDKFALESSSVQALNSLGIEILSWQDKSSLQRALDKKKEEQSRRKKEAEKKEKDLKEIEHITLM